LLLTTV